MGVLRLLCGALIGLGLTPSPAHADGLSLDPTSDWKLRELDDKCRVSRTFGSGEDRVTLWLDQGGLTPTYNLTVIGRPLRNPYGSGLSVQFVPGPEYRRAYLKATSSKGRPVISMFGVRLLPTAADVEVSAPYVGTKAADDQTDHALAELERATEAANPTPTQIAAVTHLRLAGPLAKPLVLATGSLTDPFAQLQDCAERLEERWKDYRAETATPATPKDQARWAGIISQNYPRHMLRAEQQGSIGVELTIGRNGRPSNCEIISVIGPTSFNDTVCLLMMKHATFTPARNSEGEPIPGRFRQTVTFRLN